jgi:rhodanese-related sulfurtransferase
VEDLKVLKTFDDPIQLIDVRSPSEYAAGHIPGAANIPLEQLDSRVSDLEPRGQIVLICQSGTRAKIAANLLERFREDLLVLEGGTAAWARAGLPTVANTAARWSLERQVRLGAGLLVLLGVTLALSIDLHWIYFSAFIGAGLTFAGLTDFCPMGRLLALMPWNRASRRMNQPSTCA